MVSLRGRRLWSDGLLAAALAVVVIITTVTARLDDNPGLWLEPGMIVTITITCGLLTFRRRWPLATLLAVFAATMAYALLGYPYGPIFLAPSVALGNYTSRSPRTAGIVATAVTAVAHLPYAILSGREPDDSIALNIAISVTWICASGVIGMIIKHAAEQREHAKAEERRRFASEERLRVAREVHDVVGHGLAAINLHARVALHVLQRENVTVPEAITDSLHAIRDSGSAALDELRATLEPLSAPTGQQRPVLTLADVESAVATALSTDGLSIDVAVAGQRGPIPAVVDSAGYRIVQESLTNVVKHADATRADVDISYAPGLVTIRVTDNGHGPTDHEGEGHGMTGMAERATSLGGRFHAGPEADGGFTVTAELPYAIVER